MKSDPKRRIMNSHAVDQGTGCWLWQGLVNKSGYGKLKCTPLGEHLAHRVAFRILVGDIPESMCVLHKCDTPKCVNPEHLFLGTQADNVADMVQKGRARVPMFRGEQCHSAKLTEGDVIRIREMRSRGALLRDIAQSFGITESTAQGIVKGRLWGHLPILSDRPEITSCSKGHTYEIIGGAKVCRECRAERWKRYGAKRKAAYVRKPKTSRANIGGMRVLGVAADGSTVEFPSINQAGRSGFNAGHISECVRGKRPSHRGYKWEVKAA
jgi:hypothetical protein